VTRRVLIADDSLTVRMDLAEAFEAAGLAVEACSTLAAARSALARGGIGLAVLDICFPDGDGIELLEEIRATPGLGDIAVLLLSSEAEVQHRVRGISSGADDYVGKPYDRDWLVARARELLHLTSGDAGPRLALLVIDDSVTFREERRRARAAAGYAVRTAENGQEGLRLAARHRPAGVIVDGVMPDLDGSTVIRRIRLDAALRGTPCLLLTAADDRSAELRAFDAGADAFVRKAESLEVILARVAAILRGTSARRDPRASLLGPKRLLAVDDRPGVGTTYVLPAPAH